MLSIVCCGAGPRTFCWCKQLQNVELITIMIGTRDARTLASTLPIAHAHRYIGPRNATGPMTTSVRLMYLGVSDGRDSTCEPDPSPSPRSSLTHAHRCERGADFSCEEEQGTVGTRTRRVGSSIYLLVCRYM